jgi:radical S-adenosyl methionine domain-containing protein 2
MKNNQFLNQSLSVNFHLWQPCNYSCGFCFAGFEDVKKSILPAGHLSQEKAESVIRQLAEYGFKKITFAGGEPTLCPWLGELISVAKNAGMVTMIVTNGSRLNEETLIKYQPVLDWIVLSIDSINTETNLKGGRFQNKRLIPDALYYRKLIDSIHSLDFKFKINTVVHQFNKDEVIADFIEESNPLRWKIFKVLSIENQNQGTFGNFEISDEEFKYYLKRNTNLITEKLMVPEDNEAMSSSYLMIDPAGRFFDNSKGIYTYSEAINDVGVERALEQTEFDCKKYIMRGAVYEW